VCDTTAVNHLTQLVLGRISPIAEAGEARCQLDLDKGLDGSISTTLGWNKDLGNDLPCRQQVRADAPGLKEKVLHNSIDLQKQYYNSFPNFCQI
jgi:hypothetical protein